MDRSPHGPYLDDEEGLYAEPTLSPTSRPLHDRPSDPEPDETPNVEDLPADHRHESSSPRLSSVARSSSHTATTARSIASTNLSTLATSASHGSSNMAQDSKDAAALRAHQQQHSPPTMTIFDLESDTATSSALPQPFGFSISRKGRIVAVFGTKNIWIIDANKLPEPCVRTLEVRRKPVAVEVLDDAGLLAVLSNPFKVDLYHLQVNGAPTLEKVKSIILTVDASTIALSPDGMVLATGYSFGIELVSLAEKASENDRRSVNCDPMDHLMFSDDGRTLIATASARMPRPTTVFSVHGAFDGPLTEDGDLIPQECHIAWTRQILFPEKAHTAKHALILPDPLTGHVNELFAFDAEEDTWGIYDLGGMQFIETKENPPQAGQFVHAESLEDALPTVSPSFDHVAVAVKNQDSNSFWVYRLPDTFESSSAVYNELKQHSGDHSPLAPCSYVSMPREEDTNAQDISGLRWITQDENNDRAFERLLAVGNVVCATAPDTPIMPGDAAKTKGILIMMDFDLRNSIENHNPKKAGRVTVDLDQTLPGEKLPEDEIDFEREVELARTRTVAQKRGEAARAVASHNLLRSSTATSPQAPTRAPASSRQNGDDYGQAVLEEPYVQGQPRSQASLTRAATVAAASPANRRHLRALPDRPLEYRRADGLREVPHESDADNWIPPPPPYTPRADPPGPGAISISLSHPEGAPLPTVPSPPLAQNSTLPRLQIPNNGYTSPSSNIPNSAPVDRGHPTPQPAAPRSAIPTSRAPRIARPESHRYSLPAFQSHRPGTGSRYHTSPSQAPFRPPPEDPAEPSAQHPGILPEDAVLSGASNPLGLDHLARPPSPSVSPTSAPSQAPNFHRSESVPTPVTAFATNPRAAQSVDDFGPGPSARRRAGIRGLRRFGHARGQGDVQRMSTIRSVRSTGGMRIRSSGAPLAGDDEVMDTPGSRDGDGFRKRMRCVVM